MKILNYLLIISAVFASDAVAAKESHQKLIDELWANRVLNTEKLQPGINELEANFSHLSDNQRAELNNLKSYLLLLKGDIEESLAITNKVIKQNISFDLLARAKNIQINALVFSGEFKKAFLEMYELLDKLEQVESDDLKLHIMHSAVIRHSYAEIYDKAIELSKKNIALSKKLKASHYYCLAIIEGANIELALNNYEQADTELKLAMIECEKHGESVLIQYIKYKLAKIAFAQGNYQNVIDSLKSIYTHKKNEDYKVLKLEVATLLAKSLVELDQYKDVYDYAKKAFDFANSNNYLYLKRDAAEVLAKYYKKKKNLEEFERYKEIYRETLIKVKVESNYRIAQYYSAMMARKNK